MKRFIYLVLALLLPFQAMAAQQTVTDEGAFTYQTRTIINSNFTELYNAIFGTVFSTGRTSNPLVLDNYANTFVSTIGLYSTGVTTLIASTAGKTIYPTSLKIMASGTAATATGLAIECSDGTLIASWPTALLTSLNPLDAYSSTVVGRGSALGMGCPASTGVVLSNVGAQITTTTYVGTHVLYVNQ